MASIARLIRDEIERHAPEIPGSGSSRDLLREIIAGTKDQGCYEESLKSLSRFLHEQYKIPPVILIDEYDTPIHAAWQYGYYEDMIAFMRGLLSAVLKDNPHIFKGVLTGILRVAKESIFSDLNNLGTYTILKRPFADKFGITQEELAALMRRYQMEERLAEADAWYNGYRFGNHTIFNPWSILNFIDAHPDPPEPYWANTSSNALIRDLIINGGMDVRENIERLIAGKSIESVIDQNIVFPNLHKQERYIYSLFFFSGYLKCIEQLPDPRRIRCKLSVPNQEVLYIFENIIGGNGLMKPLATARLNTMLNALVQGNLDLFERLLREFVITTLSFFDAKGQESRGRVPGLCPGHVAQPGARLCG